MQAKKQMLHKQEETKDSSLRMWEILTFSRILEINPKKIQ